MCGQQHQSYTLVSEHMFASFWFAAAVYVGDVFLMEEKDVIHTDLTVRAGLEVVVSVGMAVPPNMVVTKF